MKEVINSCFEARKAELKADGVAGRWISPLQQHVIPAIGAHPITDINQHAVKRVLDPIWHEKADTATKCLNRLSLSLKQGNGQATTRKLYRFCTGEAQNPGEMGRKIMQTAA